MPSSTKKQARFMAAVAHSPSFAKKVGVPQSVGKEFNQALIHLLELEFLVDIAGPVAIGALERRESRGSHSRVDYPERNDEMFLKHSMTRLKDGKIVLEYSDVTLGRFEVKERTY